LFAAPVTALASEPEWLSGSPSDRVRAESSASAKARVYLDERSDALVLGAVELGTGREIAGLSGSTVRMDQTHGGLRVLGRAAIVRIGEGGDVTRLILHVARDLTISTTPTVTRQEADGVLASLGVARSERAEVVISPLGEGALLWELDVRDRQGGMRYWIDAHTGELFGQKPLAVHALGRVYTMNSIETPMPADVELLELDLTADPLRLNGWNGLLTVTNYLSGTSNGFELEQVIGPTSGQDFLYDPPADVSDATDAFAQVNLYHHLTSMKAFAATLGVPIDQGSWKLTAVANALEDGMALDNAFFSPMGQQGTFASPNLIAIGQGSQNDFAYDSDVFKHEFGHYLSHNAIGYNLGQLNFNEYGLSPHSGSIDEGISDYLACSDNDDAELGEASLAQLGGLRDLTDTSMVCPDDILGEVHEDGQIAGSLAWSIRELLGKDIADQIVWNGLTLMPPGGTFGDLGRGFITAAEDLAAAGTITGSDLGEIEALVASRGLDNCDHVIRIEPGESKVENAIGLTFLGQLFGQGCATLQGGGAQIQGLFHFSRQTAADDQVLRFQVDAQPVGAGDAQFSIYARKSDNVTLNGGGGFLPVPDNFDQRVDVDAQTGELIIDQAAGFEPGAEYFFIVMNRGCPNLRITVTTSTEPLPPATTTSSSVTSGAGGDGSGAGPSGAGGGGTPNTDDEKDDDGCGCHGSSGVPGGAGAGLLALGLAALLRRRRRG
jgi:MYXO-CTERM domain-containing protein